MSIVRSAPSARLLTLLAEEADPAAYDEVVADAERAGADEADLAELRRLRDLALSLHEQRERSRVRESELAALYETAGDLTGIRDLDAILAAIVRRARQLLRADMTYLSLNDEDEGASYMKVTEGALTPEFATLRLPLGTGLLGLVAQTGAPYFTEDYQADERFVHRADIDDAVAGEGIRAILGVPLIVEGSVIGALLAVHREVRRFPPREVSLLMSFAAHAAVALENARLFDASERARAAMDAAHRELSARNQAVERAASVHDRLTDLVLHGGGVAEVVEVLSDSLGAQVAAYDETGALLAGSPADQAQIPNAYRDAIAEARRSGRSAQAVDGSVVAVAAAGTDHLGTLLLKGHAALDLADRRTFERGALVTALVLLFGRAEAEAEDRVRGELLVDLVEGRLDDRVRLRERLRRHRAELDQAVVVAVAAVRELPRHRAAKVAAALAASHHGLAGEHHGQIVLAVPADDPLSVGREVQSRTAAAGGCATVGVATSKAGADGIPAAYDDARRCVVTLLTLGREGEVSDPAGLGLARLLLGHNGADELAAFLTETLGPVEDYDQRRGTDLVLTLEGWFASGGSPAETARRLHVHPNTVTQRLQRIDSLLGAGWRAPDRSLDLQLALRVRRLQRTT